MPLVRAYPSAAYAAFSSLQHPTQSMPGNATTASSMGKAKSPATPDTLDTPRSLSLERTCSTTVVAAIFRAGTDSCNLPLVDAASFIGANTCDIIDLLKHFGARSLKNSYCSSAYQYIK